MEIYSNRYTTASLTAIIATLLLMGVAMANGYGNSPQTAGTTASATVNEWISVTLSGVPIEFPIMDPGAGPISAGVDNGYPLTATIGSETNVDVDISTEADAVTFTGPSSLAVSNMKWSIASEGTYIDYTDSITEVCDSVSASGTCDIYHQLTVPAGTTAGAYSVGIIITATQHV